MNRRKSKQVLPQYNSNVRDLLKLLFHMNRYFQRLSLRANTLMEMATVNHSILYFHRSCPEENYRMYQKRQERQQEHVRLEQEILKQELSLFEEPMSSCGGAVRRRSLPLSEGDNDSRHMSRGLLPSTSGELEYSFDTNVRTLEDMELLEENCRLRMCLEDYERGVELIMHKLREQFEDKILQEEFILRDLADDNLWQLIGKQRDTKTEMAVLMRKAASVNESAHLKNIETLSYLIMENRSLRELLLISKEFGTYQQPIRYNEYYRVDVSTQTDMSIQFEGFQPLAVVAPASAENNLQLPSEDEQTTMTPSTSLTSLVSVVSADSLSTTSSKTSVVSVRENDVTLSGLASDEDDDEEWTGNSAGDGAGDALDSWASDSAYEEAMDEPCDESVDGIYNEAACASLCITGIGLIPPTFESTEAYVDHAITTSELVSTTVWDGDQQLVGVQIIAAPVNVAAAGNVDVNIEVPVTDNDSTSYATEGICEKLVLVEDDTTHHTAAADFAQNDYDKSSDA